MKTRWIVITIVLLLSLVATSSVSTGQGLNLPKWEVAFDPVPYFGENTGTSYGVVFKDKMYFSFWGPDSGEQVWGTKDGKNWSLAWDLPAVTDGFTDVYGMTVFKNQLYFILSRDETGSEILRTADGKYWEIVTWGEEEGSSVCRMTTFKNALYIAYCNFDGGMTLYRSTNANPGTWKEVAQFPDWIAPSTFETFKGALYMGSDDRYGPPAQIVRSYDGVNWEMVTPDGFGDPNNLLVWGFGQRNGYLYASTGSWEGGDIWRSRDGMSWEPVSKDGLGNPNNLAFGFVTYKNLLYTYSVNNAEGCSVYSSKDGVHWMPANEPGWGDPVNIAVYLNSGRVVFKGALYMGIWGGSGRVMKLVMP